MSDRRDRLIALVLFAATVVLYGWHLDRSPLHLHYDEIFFGLQAHSIHATGRDLNGLSLPVYFQLDITGNWYQPLEVYWTALLLWFLPLSDTTIRMATVIVAAISVTVMFVLAREVLRDRAWAVIAAVMLMLTPGHFIHGRVAMDWIYPVPFFAGWAFFAVRFLESRSTPHIVAAAACLGGGFFSYIAGTALTPFFLAATLFLLWSIGDSKRIPAAVAGFALPLVVAAIFVALHPAVVPGLMSKYGFGGGANAAGAGLDPIQRLRESLTPSTISDTLNRYWRFYSPGYLFVTGGSNLTNSTRLAGVFFPPIAVFLVAGIWRILSTRRIDGALLLFGFLVAPIPAALLKEDFAVDRELVKLPFVVLIAAIGAQWLWRVPSTPSLGRALRFAALGLLVLTAGYGALGVIRDGRLGATIPLGVAAAVAAFAIGVALQRTATWSPMVAALLLLLPLMFVPFVRDYFDGYPMRSSGWFGGNIRGAIDAVIASDGRESAPEIHISTDIPYIRSYWLFYQHVYHREDLAAKSKMFDRNTIDLSQMARGSLVLASGTDAVVSKLASRGELRRVAAIKDRDDQSDPDQFVIYRR